MLDLELIYQKYYRWIWHESTSPTFCLYCTGSCYDYVEAHDGSSGSDPSLGKFCGTLRPFTLLSSSNVMLVRFVSDDSQNFGGFQFTYSAEGTVNAWNIWLDLQLDCFQSRDVAQNNSKQWLMFCIVMASNSLKTFSSFVLCTNTGTMKSGENHL